MKLTEENVLKWFKGYFEDVDKYQGNIETIPNIKKHFAPELKFIMYTAPQSSGKSPRSREALLMTFIHPGLREKLVPNSYIVDLSQMIVIVQFEINFSDHLSGKAWPSMQASAHYFIKPDDKNGLLITKILYWTEALAPDLLELWGKRRDEALSGFVINYINSK